MSRHGTDRFSGLNTTVDPALLSNHMLVECLDADLVSGAAAPQKDASVVVAQGTGDAAGLLAFRRDGTEHIIYRVGRYIYEDSSSTQVWDGGQGTEDPTYFVAVDGKVYIFIANTGTTEKVLVWDGTYTRDAGGISPSAQGTAGIDEIRPSGISYGITSIANGADPAVVTLDSTYDLATGGKHYIDGVSGMTEVNEKVFTITNISTTTVSLDGTTPNVSGWDAGTGGTMYPNASGLNGVYSYWRSNIVTMPDGTERESELVPLTGRVGTSAAGESVFTISPTDLVAIYAPKITAAEASAYIDPTTGLGTTLLFQIRIYRTKVGGSSQWLLKEYTHAESYGTGNTAVYYDQIPDWNLGALFLYNIDEFTAPPVSSNGIYVGGRMFYVSGSKLYFSLQGLIEKVDPDSNHEFDDEITAIGQYGSQVAVFSESRFWVVSQPDDVGYVTEVDTPVGCSHPRSVVLTPYGLVWAESTGLWLYNGTQPIVQTLPIEDDWRDALGLNGAAPSWSGEFWRERLYFSSRGSLSTYPLFVGRMHQRGISWMRESAGLTAQGIRAMSSNSDTNILYAMIDGGGIYSIYGGSASTTKTIKTKKFGERKISLVDTIRLDIDTGGSDETITLYNNRGGSEPYTVNTSTRQIKRLTAPIGFRAELFWIGGVGPGTLYGVVIGLV